MNTELITVIANIALTVSFVIALVFGIAQVQAAARDRRERLTLDTLRSFQTREFSKLALYVNMHDLPTNLQDMQAMPYEDQVNVFQYGQQMENLGILLAEGLINIDLVDKTLGSFVVTTWEKYEPLFTDIRINQPDPFLGEYFQWLAGQIKERMEKNPREPFYKTKKQAPK